MSTFVALFLAATLAQVLIQVSLSQERHSRVVASLMDVQETRSQRLFRDALLLLVPTTPTAQTLQEMRSDTASIERTNTGILVGDAGLRIAPSDFSSDELAKIRAVQPSEKAMIAASNQLAEQVKSQTPARDLVPSITTLFYQEPLYFAGTKAVLDRLTSDADARVQEVQIFEICLYGFFVLLLIVEAVTIARPALKQLKHALDDLGGQASQE